MVSDEAWKHESTYLNTANYSELAKSIEIRSLEIKKNIPERAVWGNQAEKYRADWVKIAALAFFQMRIGIAHGYKLTKDDEVSISKSQALLNEKLGFDEKDLDKEVSNLQRVAQEAHLISGVGRLLNNYERFKIAEEERKAEEVKAIQQRLLSLTQAADRGDIESQVELGKHYLQDRNSDLQAAFWFKKAAEQGNPLAQYELGQLYVSGKDVPNDEKIAETWFEKSAAQNNFDAKNMLSVINKNRIEKAKERELVKIEKAKEREIVKLENERKVASVKKKQEEEKAVAERESARLEKQRNLEKLKSL